MEEDSLNFKLPVFEGPLDLLLHLIDKNKVDIYDIPITEITRQYLAYLKQWDEMNLEVASEFIVMAAELINIKAKKLLPLAQQPEEEEEDDEADLVRRLLLYKQFKEAGAALSSAMDPSFQHVYVREPQEIGGTRPLPTPAELLKDVSLSDLGALFVRLEKSRRESYDDRRAGFRSVKKETYKVSEKIIYLEQTLDLVDQISFDALRQESHSKEETITYFMAMLELSRMNLACLSQKDLFGDIIVTRKPVEEEHDQTLPAQGDEDD